MKNILCCLLLTCPLWVFAQTIPDTRGFLLSPSLGWASINYDEEDFDDKDTGGGLELRIGYGVSRNVTLFVELSGYQMEGQENDVLRDNYTLGVFSLGGRFHLGKVQKSPVFYLEAALQSGATRYENNGQSIELNGAGLGLGVGMQLFFSERFGLDIGLRGSGGRVHTVKFNQLGLGLPNDGFNYSFGRFSVGALWYL